MIPVFAGNVSFGVFASCSRSSFSSELAYECDSSVFFACDVVVSMTRARTHLGQRELSLISVWRLSRGEDRSRVRFVVGRVGDQGQSSFTTMTSVSRARELVGGVIHTG